MTRALALFIVVAALFALPKSAAAATSWRPTYRQAMAGAAYAAHYWTPGRGARVTRLRCVPRWGWYGCAYHSRSYTYYCWGSMRMYARRRRGGGILVYPRGLTMTCHRRPLYTRRSG